MQPNKVALYPEDIYEYYRTNDYPTPESLKEIIPIDAKRRGVKSQWETYNEDFKTRGGLPLIWPEQEKKLEEIIKSDGKLDDKIYLWGDSYLNISRIMEKAKKTINSQEYLTFLTAIIDSRIFQNCLNITNTGDVDLNKISVEIPAPYSVLTNSRKGNIKEDIGVIPFQAGFYYELSSEQLNLNIRELKIKEGFPILIYTKGSEIDKNEISFNYIPVRTIDKGRYLVYLMIVFIFLLFIFCLWKSKVEP
jgi:hypothetical protein